MAVERQTGLIMAVNTDLHRKEHYLTPTRGSTPFKATHTKNVRCHGNVIFFRSCLVVEEIVKTANTSYIIYR